MSVLATDSFTRANAANLGANWTVQFGHSAITILSNTATVTLDPAAERYSAATWPANQYSQAKVTTLAAGGNSVGAGVRFATTADNSFYAYNAEDTTDTVLFKAVVGGYTTLGTDAASSVNDVLKCQAVGTTISAFRNGGAGSSVTDSSLATGMAGIVGFGSGALDDFEGGDFVTTGLPEAGMDVATMSSTQASMMR